MGVSISIDDFGTGYSMLARLHRFPVDRLKIDRSFVREIVSPQAEAPIVAAIIAMARSLGIETVAEGVETLEQQTYLRNRSCDLAQGFLFSYPSDATEIGRLLRTPSVGFNLGTAELSWTPPSESPVVTLTLIPTRPTKRANPQAATNACSTPNSFGERRRPPRAGDHLGEREGPVEQRSSPERGGGRRVGVPRPSSQWMRHVASTGPTAR